MKTTGSVKIMSLPVTFAANQPWDQYEVLKAIDILKDMRENAQFVG